MKWSRQRFCEELLDSVPSANERQKFIMGFLESISRLKLNFDLNDSKVEESTDANIRDILDAHPELTSDEQTDDDICLLIRCQFWMSIKNVANVCVSRFLYL